MTREQSARDVELTPNLRLVRPLGRGGMGVLWIAEHRTLGNEVVVKFLSDELVDDPSAAKRIAREAAAAANVKSPHVVQVFDHGVSKAGVPFIVMERLVGCDLRAFLEARGALPIDQTTTIVHQLAKALEKTHAAGFVHRDVKPSNIFLCDFDSDIFLKLLDFGLAQRPASAHISSAGSHHCAGTPPYMSPEQIVGAPVDTRSDIWSLGAVAFECLTGKRAFVGETLGAFALAIHTLSLPSLTQIRPELPAAIDTWFGRACSRSPDDRFGSAMETAEAMARALGAEVPSVATVRPLPLVSLRDRTITDDFALTRAEGTRGVRPKRALSAWIAAVSLVGAGVAAAAGAYRASARSASGPSARRAEVATAPTTEAAEKKESPTLPEAPAWVAIEAPAPPKIRAPHSSPPVEKRVQALAPPPVVPAIAVPAIASSPSATRTDELPDERY